MKTIDSCAKCGSNAVLRVPGDPDSRGGGRIRTGMTWLSSVPISRFVCTACGYIELWVDTPGAIAGIVAKWGSKAKSRKKAT